MNSSLLSPTCKGLKNPSSKMKQNPYNFARIARELTRRTSGISRETVPRRIISGGSRAGWRKARSAAQSIFGSASNTRLRTVIASNKICSVSLRSRSGRRKLESQTSGGRVIQSHSRVSLRNSTRSSRSGEREISPNRICLRIERTKSATSHNCRIYVPSFFFLWRFRLGWQRHKDHELHRDDGLRK